VALIYNAENKTWSYTPEKTTYAADRSEFHFENALGGRDPDWLLQYYRREAANGTGSIVKNADGTENYVLTYPVRLAFASQNIRLTKKVQSPQEQYNAKLNKEAEQLNKENTEKNAFYTKVNSIANATRQGSYNYLDAKQSITSQKNTLISVGISNADADKIITGMIGNTGQFRSFYLTERITPWDPSVLPSMLSSTVKQREDVQPDKFNTYSGVEGKKGYYINETKEGKKAKDDWNAAIAADNLDIISRYASLETYAYQDYLNQITTRSPGEVALIRGSQVTSLSPLVSDYREQVFPDIEKQQTLDKVQNKIFGLIPTKQPGATGYEFKDTQQDLSDLVSKDPTFNKLWTGAKEEALLSSVGATTSTQWKDLTNSLGVKDTILKQPDSFGALLARISILDETNSADKKIIDDNKELVKTISDLKNNEQFKTLVSYVPEVNDVFQTSVLQFEKQQAEKFGQLRQDVLKDTIAQLKLAKQQENNISFFKTSSVGQEVTSLEKDITGSLLGDLSVGGVSPLASAQKNLSTQLDLGLGNIFGTRNGLIYNWEDWFNNQIEKKYAGSIDIPNDYVPLKQRTLSNGFVDTTTINSWKKYDDAYATLKINPNDFYAKTVVADKPTNYVPVANRRLVNQTWVDYEKQLKDAGYIDAQTLASWSQYDDKYSKTNKIPKDAPADYIIPARRMDRDVQFAKDFFSQYLKPRFDSSQSITEFQDYIDVTKNTQNPFQTQDRLNALKLAAQTSVSQWFTNLQKAGDSKFNSDYYFDPAGYLQSKGIGDPKNPLLPGTAFTNYASTDIGKITAQQSTKVNADWEAAKNGLNTTDAYGNTINWLQQAYNYGVDLNNKAAFAQLHYQLVGLNAPELDANGNIVRDADGQIKKRAYDPAPDVYAPLVAKTYITEVLTPYLLDKANKIGSVFGEFIKPADYVEEILKVVSLPENKEHWANILSSNKLNPNASLTELKDTLVKALSQDSTTNIQQKIGDLIKDSKKPTQIELGVEYLQKTPPIGTESKASGIYAIFKNAGYNGTESDFYSTFLPDSSEEDINILNAAYTPAGQISSLLPTISGTGTERIASMAQLFGDTSISEVLGTAGITTPQKKSNLVSSLFTTSENEVGIGDPFADASTSFTTSSEKTKTDNKIGIDNPFDTMGIADPFAEDSDPFFSDNPFSNIGSTSSISTPKIKVNVNASIQGFSSSKNTSIGSLFDSFGGGFGF